MYMAIVMQSKTKMVLLLIKCINIYCRNQFPNQFPNKKEGSEKLRFWPGWQDRRLQSLDWKYLIKQVYLYRSANVYCRSSSTKCCWTGDRCNLTKSTYRHRCTHISADVHQNVSKTIGAQAYTCIITFKIQATKVSTRCFRVWTTSPPQKNLKVFFSLQPVQHKLTTSTSKFNP